MQSSNLQSIFVPIASAGLLMTLGAFLVLLSLYLVYALRDILVVIKNYNFRQAQKCHWASCGLYHHDEDDPQSKDCLHPFVGKPFFERLSRHGNQPGCDHSIQVREVDVPRKPAIDYRKEFLDIYSTLNVYGIWWKVITILVGILLTRTSRNQTGFRT